MTHAGFLPRSWIILGVVLPLAAFIGYVLATPDAVDGLAFVGLIVGILSLPVLLRWHHLILVMSWNATLTVFFLPGQPSLWMLMALISLLLTLTGSLLNKDFKFQNVPLVTWSLLFLAAVVLITAKLTGGIGVRALGGTSYGGKRYFHILFAICAYFALSWQVIPLTKAPAYVGAFFLSGLTTIVSNLAYLAGPAFYFLFLFFPASYAEQQIIADLCGDLVTPMTRLGGLAFAGLGCFSFFLARYGITGLMDFTRPWRFALLSACMGLSLLGGFRSVLIQYGLIFVFQFFLEGLHRTRLLPILTLSLVIGGAALVPLSSKLPLSVQRSLSFLPLQVDPVARLDAQASVRWRLDMWQVVLPEVPHYLFLGKGYTLNPTDLYLMGQSMRRGLARDYESSLLAGDYHNGPLSILIPFGIFGMLAVLLFLIAGGSALINHYKYGHPSLKLINSFLLAAFLTRVVWFFVFFGGISSDLYYFAGLVGLSVSLNGGLRRKEPSPQLVSNQITPEHGRPGIAPA